MTDAELNRQCAEKVMGWDLDCLFRPMMIPCGEFPCKSFQGKQLCAYPQGIYFCNDLVAVFGPGGVVETLRAKEIYLDIGNYPGYPKPYFRVKAWHRRGLADHKLASVIEDSVCRAIVIAAIKAVGGKDND